MRNGWHRAASGVVALALLATGARAGDFAPVAGEAWPAIQQRYLDWNKTQPGWTQTASGLQYERLSAANPAGAVAKPDSVVTVGCEGHLVDGRLFFATEPDKPLIAPLTKLIKGWQEGVLLMHAGETWQFVLPAALAYGEKGWQSHSPNVPSIPPGTVLVFKISLVAVGPAAPASAGH